MRASCDYFRKNTLRADILCLTLFDDLKLDAQAKAVDKLLGGQISEMIKQRLFKGSKDEVRALVPHPRKQFKELLLIGLGSRRQYDGERLRQCAGVCGGKACRKGVGSMAFVLPEIRPRQTPVSLLSRAAVEGVNLGSYFLDRFKSKPADLTKPAKFTVLLPNKMNLMEANAGAKVGLIVSDLQNHCRNLVGYPSNLLTPTQLADEARKLARQSGLKAQVYNRAQIEKLNMGAFLSVARGSHEPPRLIRLDYRPKGRAKHRVVLVGKGITFDSGGISIKPSLNMGEMKQDMGGAAVVICTAAAVARLRLPIHLTVLVPTCENLPGGGAYKPGDVLTTCIGKTIEVISTDAEGRLILADALGYGSRMEPDYMIDVATLTGAVIYALGHSSSAILGTSPKLIDLAREAADITGERTWQLPLWDDYEYLIESDIADIKNSGGKPAGTITATRLLKHFTGDVPWAHVDIAGMDLEFRGRQYTPKGASGYGVRLLTELLSRLD
jgi:leucyl aminopeptidase